MFQIRLHGRGGQGVVTSAEMLSLAAFTEGHYAQAFPSFGSERTGAPVVAFARVSDKPIRLREPIMEPPEELGLEDLVNRLPKGHVITLPATKFALARIGRPLPGAAMLAGFAALTGKLKLESVQQAFQTRYKGKVAQANADVAADAYSFVLEAKNRL